MTKICMQIRVCELRERSPVACTHLPNKKKKDEEKNVLMNGEIRKIKHKIRKIYL